MWWGGSQHLHGKVPRVTLSRARNWTVMSRNTSEKHQEFSFFCSIGGDRKYQLFVTGIEAIIRNISVIPKNQPEQGWALWRSELSCHSRHPHCIPECWFKSWMLCLQSSFALVHPGRQQMMAQVAWAPATPVGDLEEVLVFLPWPGPVLASGWNIFCSHFHPAF